MRALARVCDFLTVLVLQVAIRYSGVESGKKLPMVLEIRPGAVDRGACIKEFSQYQAEVEYLWVPGSFMEPVYI